MQSKAGTGVLLEPDPEMANDAGPTWRQFDIFHDSVHSVPATAGVLRSATDPHGPMVLVHDLRGWVAANRFELAAGASLDEPFVDWALLPQHELERMYVEARESIKALRAARPTQIPTQRAMGKVPPAWGLYRIRKADGTCYVGISSNLRSRLQTHARSGRLDFDHGDDAEFLLAKQGDDGRVVTWHDLQLAEREHIQRMKDRGVPLVNQVAGGNGLPPAVRFALNEVTRKQALKLETGSARSAVWERGWMMGDVPAPMINLGVYMSDVHGEWRLFVEARPDVQVVALARGTGQFNIDTRLSGSIPLGDASDRYAASTVGRDLVEDITTRFLEYDELPAAGIPATELPLTFWWPAVGAVDDSGRHSIVPSSLQQLTAADVLDRKLPEKLAQGGLHLDDTFEKGYNLNRTIRLENNDGARIYAKTEQNPRAVRAELLASMIWHQLGWRGISTRSVVSEDGSVLVIAPVGGAGVEDHHSFNEKFWTGADDDWEDRSTIDVPGAMSLLRVTLDELKLADDMDVVRFVVTNAAWGTPTGTAETSTMDGSPTRTASTAVSATCFPSTTACASSTTALPTP